jgi:hypothetical protein
LGFRVLSAEASEITRAELERRAREAGAAVALSTRETERGVELWLVDRVTGKTLFREVLERDLESADPDAVVALRVVELLRASLLELELEHPPRGDVPAAPELRQTAVRHERAPPETASDPTEGAPENSSEEGALIAGLGAAVSSHVGATRATPGLSPVALWQPTRRVAVGFWGLLPFGTAEVSTDDGAVEVRTWSFGSGFRFEPFSPRARFRPSVGAGAAVTWMNVEGVRAQSDLMLSSGELVAAGPSAELGCGLRIAGGLALRADGRAVVAFPRPVIEFVGQEVASLGRPLVSLSLGLEYRAVLEASRD